MEPLTSLAAASIALVGTHFAFSHPLRAPLVRAVGATGFLGLYSVVAAACMVWMYFAFTASPPGGLGGTGDVGWILATVLTLPALVLFFGSLVRNPALPAPGAEKIATQEPSGAMKVTRHPMMWGFALWAISHLVLWWSWRTVIVALAILILALVGARLQDRKKEALMGDAWTQWESRTSYWPRWGRLRETGAVLWLVALVAWLAITWAHIHAAGIPAGIWRWIG
ncbi:NnrU family protein [Qipengyuania zhejiangensis]|uniref:NnrU family protein n=1 Tax=Qipengyuania zhejiangensis TaxID=3077782 RepID=UPI002D76BAA7|nr:NnrU family protein [Qipengyuania sp. Z2]